MKSNFRAAKNYIFTENKLCAISNLEIIICLIIITVIVFLTTPFLSHIDKKPKDSFGTFACYSVFDEKTKTWKLHEISRYNSDYENNEGELSRDDLLDECKFIKPEGVDKFDIYVIGGGGGGSSAVRTDCNKENNINCYLKGDDFKLYTSSGKSGKNGQIISKNNVLLKDVFDFDNKTSRYILKLNLCLEGDYKTINPSASNKACVGIGGEGGNGYSYLNYYNVSEVINDIVSKYNSTKYVTDEFSNLSKEYMVNTINLIKPEVSLKLKEFYDSYNESEDKYDKTKFEAIYRDLVSLAKTLLQDKTNLNVSQARNGTASKFLYNSESGIQQITANGGEGGYSSAENYTENVVKKSKVYLSGEINTDKAENIPAEILSVLKPENDFIDTISNCSETNTSCDGDDAKYYIGAGGDGGGVVFNFGSQNRNKDILFHDYLKNNIPPYFRAGHGGRGGGGAIIIRW